MASNQKRKRFLLGVFFSALGAVCWGFSGTCAQFLFENYDIHAVFMIMLRTFIAALCFGSAILVGKRTHVKEIVAHDSAQAQMALQNSPDKTPSFNRRMLRLVLFGLTLLMSQFFYVLTISVTNAGTATVIMMLYLIFVMMYTSSKGHRLPTIWEMLGLVLAIFGTVVIATQGDITTLNLPPEGLFFGVMSALGCAGYIIVPKPLLNRYDTFTVTGLGMVADAIFAFVIWCVFSLVTGNLYIPTLDAVGVAALVIGMSVIGTFSAFWFFMKGVAMAGTMTSSLIGALEPTSAMIFSTIWLGTAFTGFDWLGFVAMIVMLFIISIV